MRYLFIFLLIGCTTTKKTTESWNEVASVKLFENSKTGEVMVIWDDRSFNRSDLEDLIIEGMTTYEVNKPLPKVKAPNIRL